MIRVYDDCGNAVDLVELGMQIREDVIKKLPESLYVDGFNDGYKKGRADKIDDELQNFAQWLWNSNYLVDEAFTIRLVEQYKYEQLKEQI